MKRKHAEAMRVRSGDWPGFAQEFQDESDRAAAVLGAAWLDVRLQALLENSMVDDAKAVAPLFEPQGGLDTFSSRIRLTYALGLISRMTFDDLGLVREIRNRFAHDLHGLSFGDAAIDQACRRLQTPWKAAPAGAQLSARKLHELAVAVIAGFLEVNAGRALAERPSVKGAKGRHGGSR